MSILRSCWSDDSGQDIVEYALIVTLISVIAISALQGVGSAVSTLWDNIRNTVAG